MNKLFAIINRSWTLFYALVVRNVAEQVLVVASFSAFLASYDSDAAGARCGARSIADCATSFEFANDNALKSKLVCL